MDGIFTEIQFLNTPIEGLASSKHSHSGYQFILVTKGQVRLTVSGVSVLCKSPCVILLNTLEEHCLSDASSDYTRYYFILNYKHINSLVTSNSFIELMKYRPRESKNCISIAGFDAEFVAIFETIYKEWCSKSNYYEDKICSLISLLVVNLHRAVYSYAPQTKPPQYIIDIKQYIETNYATIGNISDVCEIFFVNKYYLSKVFKSIIGYTPKEYLTLMRLSVAKRLLTTTSMTVNEICFNAGFRDINNFIKLFKDRYTLSPLKFRKRNCLS